VAPPVFKTGLAANTVAGGFDSLPPPPLDPKLTIRLQSDGPQTATPRPSSLTATVPAGCRRLAGALAGRFGGELFLSLQDASAQRLRRQIP
jgi:hypothetical protein